MNELELVRLRHMLDAARALQSFAKGKNRAILDDDLQLAGALSKGIEIIGEAAGRLSQTTRDGISDIPWSDMIGMRNILIHDYFDMDLDQIWNTVSDDIPPLIAALEKAIPKDSP